jgi:hypothetical protein
MKGASFQPAFSRKLRVAERVSVLSKKKSSRWYKKVFSMVYQKHRDGLLKSSQWFTECIEKTFFSLSSTLYFFG